MDTDYLDHLTTDKKVYVKCPRCQRAVHYTRMESLMTGKTVRHSYCDSCRAVSDKQTEEWLSREDAAKAEMAIAFKRGRLVKEKRCRVCVALGLHHDVTDIPNRSPVHAHHTDYSKPIDVIWLCPKHHKGWHRIFEVIR